MLLHSQAQGKSALLVEMLHKLPAIDLDLALEAVLERERLGSTGIGYGVALPHGRMQALDKPLAVLARHQRGLDFTAIDAKPVYIIVLMLAPASQDKQVHGEHLRMLAFFARRLQQDNIRKQILAATSPEEISQLFVPDVADGANKPIIRNDG
ncbi:MAG: PTS sugar transporter subunit IIA [Mariprofundales bacterium]